MSLHDLADTTVHTLKLELIDAPLPIWRRLLVPSELRLSDLHQTIAKVLGWSGRKAYELEVDGVWYGEPSDDPEAPTTDASRTRLGAVLPVGSVLSYVYDLETGWRATLTAEEVGAADPKLAYPLCLEGRRAAPPEAIGGMEPFIMGVMTAQEPDSREHKEFRKLVGPSFDPEAFSAAAINERLHGKKVAAPAPAPLDPRLAAIRVKLEDIIDAFITNMEADGISLELCERALPLADAVLTVFEAERSPRFVTRADEHFDGNLGSFLFELPISLALAGEHEKAAALVARMDCWCNPVSTLAARARVAGIAGREDEARALVEQLLEEADTDEMKVEAAEILAGFDQDGAEELLRDLLDDEDADEDSLAMAGAMLHDILKATGREDEAQELADALGFSDDEGEAEAPPAPQIPVVGRNEPCPCGSGKKYKKCHGE